MFFMKWNAHFYAFTLIETMLSSFFIVVIIGSLSYFLVAIFEKIELFQSKEEVYESIQDFLWDTSKISYTTWFIIKHPQYFDIIVLYNTGNILHQESWYVIGMVTQQGDGTYTFSRGSGIYQKNTIGFWMVTGNDRNILIDCIQNNNCNGIYSMTLKKWKTYKSPVYHMEANYFEKMIEVQVTYFIKWYDTFMGKSLQEVLLEKEDILTAVFEF